MKTGVCVVSIWGYNGFMLYEEISWGKCAFLMFHAIQLHLLSSGKRTENSEKNKILNNEVIFLSLVVLELFRLEIVKSDF